MKLQELAARILVDSYDHPRKYTNLMICTTLIFITRFKLNPFINCKSKKSVRSTFPLQYTNGGSIPKRYVDIMIDAIRLFIFE